ncbi:hypothetical protein [Brachybacterium sp.]|uniref:hypothetical protein n=1 Tax=Brachybacterium sp. TaxID=1891286 RepID=UPI002ED35F6D
MCQIDDAGNSEAVPSACTRCGTVQTVDIIATGRVLSSTVGPSGAQRDGTPLAHLTAVRCADCGRDTVHEFAAGQTWDLDPEDYSDTGSWDPASQ